MKLRPESPVLPAAVREAAAVWVARLDAGLSPEERAELEAWRQADALHAAALENLSAAWGRLDLPRVRGVSPAAEMALYARERRRVRRRTTASVAAVALLAFAGWWSWPAAPVVPGVEKAPPSQVAQAAPTSRLLTLADGSVVELNAGAEIAPEFTPALRRVRLLRGEAHFAVTKDRTRPFIVDAGGVEVRAVGTAFAVRFGQTEVEVLVTEGRVAVGRPEGASNTADSFAGAGAVPVVPAGSRVLVRLQAQTVPTQVSTLSDEEISRRLAWRGTWLDFSAMRLADAVAEVNRHNREQLVIADAALADLRVSGLARADRVDDFVRLLELSGVRVERRAGGEILLRTAP